MLLIYGVVYVVHEIINGSNDSALFCWHQSSMRLFMMSALVRWIDCCDPYSCQSMVAACLGTFFLFLIDDQSEPVL